MKIAILAKVMDMVRQAQGEKVKIESLSDEVAKWLFYVALIAPAYWHLLCGSFLTDLPTALERMVTVFVVPVLMR